MIVAEDDVFTRLIQVVLDPRTPAERLTAFADFMAHDEPHFDAWCERLRVRVPELVPADVRLVTSQDDLRRALPEANAVVVESMTIGAEELALAPHLRVVQKFGTVTRNIDLAACAARGVTVRTQRRRSNTACAEWVLMTMLALSHQLTRTAGRIGVEQLAEIGHSAKAFPGIHTARNNWARIPNLRVLYEATLGLIGFGEIGREVALRAAPFGMRIVYTQRSRASTEDERRYAVTYAGIDELLAQSDFISIHLPSGTSTRGYLDRDRLEQIKPGAFLVNVARADLIDRGALLDVLRSGRLGGFALDPLYEAPGRPDDELLAFENVILTPHIGAQPRFNALTDIEEIVVGLRG